MSEVEPIPPYFNPGYIIRDRFQIQKMIDSGGFGQVFRTIDKTTGYSFALKVCEAVEDGNLLIIEQKIMRKLNNTKHFPFMVASGSVKLPSQRNQIHYVIMELLGESIIKLRKTINRKERFSIGTALRIGIQCIEALESLHDIGYVHRDIKPSNMCIGRWQFGKQRTIFLIDFGMARKFIGYDGEFREERSRVGFRGTARYVSLAVHERRETGPVDDLWSLYYSIIELGEGALPWRRMMKPKEIEVAKRKAKFTELCNRLPTHLYQFEKHLRTLQWSEYPDYSLLKSHLQECQPSGDHETPFEWEL